MTLGEHQRMFFNLFGFLHLPGLFADEIQEISRQFDTVFDDHPDDVVEWVHEFHDNRMRRFISSVTQKNTYIANLVRDHRISDLAGFLLGQDYTFTGSDASIYDCGTKYHQDGHSIKDNSRNIKMALYLDPIDSSTGAIRVIPGSHHRGDKFSGRLNRDLFLGGDKLGLTTEEVPATVLPSSPGDLILWDYRLLHATAYGGNQRKMLAFEFSHA
jgi:ectoine hydroxylase-related dioxygenase (phytanoyl-CoA dioxygenase family)